MGAQAFPIDTGSNARDGCLTASQEEAFFRRFARTHDPRLRERLVLQYVNLVRYISRRFANRGVPLDDLTQVGTVGLIQAIDRFEPGRGVRFSSFAIPTIVGEIQRYFRDKAWSMKAPRRLKEVYQLATIAETTLGRRLSRLPTVQEIAEAIGTSEEETLQALELRMVHNIASLDSHGMHDGDPTGSLAESLGTLDDAILAVPTRVDLELAFRRLDARQRTVLLQSVVMGMSQREIAEKLNISQMQVCRLLHKTQKLLQKALTQ